MVDLRAMFTPEMGVSDIARALDGLGEEARVEAVAGLRRRELSALYEAAADNEPLKLTDFVPADVPPMTEVIHEGKNSLGVFTRFQKRCIRPPAGEPAAAAELWGYNEQDMKTFTGPGYFVLHHDEHGQLVIDYRRLPPSRLPGWPPILPNSARLSRFIYNGTVDVMRRVSQCVSIGRAYRKDKPMDAWFALVRRKVAVHN